MTRRSAPVYRESRDSVRRETPFAAAFADALERSGFVVPKDAFRMQFEEPAWTITATAPPR